MGKRCDLELAVKVQRRSFSLVRRLPASMVYLWIFFCKQMDIIHATEKARLCLRKMTDAMTVLTDVN